MAEAQLAVSRRDGAFVVAVAGRLDRTTIDDLARTVRGVEGWPQATVHLDLRDVEAADATGVGMVVSLREEASRDGGDLRVGAPSEAVKEVARATDTDLEVS